MLQFLLIPLWLAVALFVFLLLVVPFLILGVLFKIAIRLLVLPFALLFGAIGLVIGILALSVAILIPLLPIAFVAFLVWAIVRASRPAPRVV